MKRLHSLALRAALGGLAAIGGLSSAARADVILPLKATASGTVEISLVTPTEFQVDDRITFSSFEPFPLTSGFFQDFVDLTIPNFPEKAFNSSFSITGPNGNALSGTFTVDTDVFPDPLHEINTGTFTITGGAGQYANATGGGTYTTFNTFRTTNQLDGGVTTADVQGTVRLVPEPETLALLGTGLLGLCFARGRMAPKRCSVRA